MITKDFLQTVVTCPEPGYFCLALKRGGTWLEEWHKWPAQLDLIVERAAALSEEADVYFSSYLFKAPQSIKENVLPTRTIQADLDEADIHTLPRHPAVLVESSPGRHQAYWVLDTTLPLEEHEALSRKMTYSIPLCDRSGWPLGRKLRIPNTLNHKYLSGPKPVKVIKSSSQTHAPDDLESLPEVPQFLLAHYDPDFLEQPQGVDEHPLELLEKIKEAIPVQVYVQYNHTQPDRSEALWALLCWAFKAGLTRHQVFTLAKHSANNKFVDLKHRADQDLAKDVLRAEQVVNSHQSDVKQLIMDLFRSGMPTIERKRAIATLVLKSLQEQGEFLQTHQGFGWYVRRDIGRPIMVTAMSEMLQTMLDIQYGLNATEPEAKYTAHALRAHVTNMQANAIQSALSYYEQDQKHLLLHTGRRAVLRITKDGVENGVDGAHGVIFPWAPSVEAFVPVGMNDPKYDWADEVFGNGRRGFGSSVNNVTNMTPEQALALLRVWFMFVLFRNVATSRPIIATFGQPGSGKSTLFKKVYAVLYGRYKSVSAVTNMDDFDYATASDPLVVLDNVDTWEKWLPDRIALAAGTSDVVKRKLYTDADTVTLRRQAILGVTAHNPRFGREDVADRFLLLAYRRLDKFVSEELILTDIMRNRNRIWGGVIRDAQRVLNTPIPTERIPQFRIEDFARFGMWIATALGCADDFRASIEDIKSAQQAFSLEEEGVLTTAITKFVTQIKGEPKYFTASQLYSMLEGCAPEPRSFTGLYRNAVVLSKKLSSMQASLKSIIRIEQEINEAGTRVWLLAPKE